MTTATGKIQGREQVEQNSLINHHICRGDRIVAASRRESPDQSVMSLMGIRGMSCAKLSYRKKNSLTS